MHSITTLCLLSFAMMQANPLEVSIKNLEGKAAKLAVHAGSKATVVVFMQFECPISSEYSTELARLANLYASKGVNFIAEFLSFGKYYMSEAAIRIRLFTTKVRRKMII